MTHDGLALLVVWSRYYIVVDLCWLLSRLCAALKHCAAVFRPGPLWIIKRRCPEPCEENHTCLGSIPFSIFHAWVCFTNQMMMLLFTLEIITSFFRIPFGVSAGVEVGDDTACARHNPARETHG